MNLIIYERYLTLLTNENITSFSHTWFINVNYYVSVSLFVVEETVSKVVTFVAILMY